MASSRDRGRTKLRGGRRYFRNLVRWPDTIEVPFGEGAWYDFWHVHPDFLGWSKARRGARGPHLAVLFEAFRRVLAEAEAYAGAAQVFVAVNRNDSSGDALYVHTSNPNDENFPYAFEPYRWDGFGVPAWLRPFLDPSWDVGETVFEGETRYLVVPRDARGPRTAHEP
jgi:hypothetical protein